MIVNLCLNVFLLVLRGLFAGIEFLHLPQTVLDKLEMFWSYIRQGASVVAAYTHYEYLLTLLAFVTAFSVAMNGYRFIMWVVRKIPYWGVD